jgi:regulator of replication initiation timing
MTKKRKTFPREDDSRDTIQKLKSQVRKLQKENRILKSEIRTLEKAYEETLNFLHDETDEISLEDLVSAAKSKKKVKTVKEEKYSVCPECGKKGCYTNPLPFGKLELCRYCEYREVKR